MHFKILGDWYSWEDLDEDEGRYVRDAFGVDHYVVMERRYWLYCDWLGQSYNMQKWGVDCDMVRGPFAFAEYLREGLDDVLEREHAAAHKIPFWIQPPSVVDPTSYLQTIPD